MLKNEKGFTLIEVMVVLIIIGVLLAISIPNLANAGGKAHEKACEANQRLIRSQLENYKLETGAYPTGTTATDIFTKLKDEHLLKKEPECPAGGHYEFTKLDGTSYGSGTITSAENVKCNHPDHGKLGD